jgi:hypothetical protein
VSRCEIESSVVSNRSPLQGGTNFVVRKSSKEELEDEEKNWKSKGKSCLSAECESIDVVG